MAEIGDRRFTGSVQVDGGVVEPIDLSATAAGVPRRIDGTETVNLDSGSEGDFTAEGLEGVGTLLVQGTWDAVVPATGPATGAAVGGTSSTQLAKDAGGIAWTVGDLRGKILRITSGAAAGEVRAILDNAAHTATIRAAAGFTSGDTWAIVEPGSDLGTVTITRNTPTIRFVACTVAALVSDGNAEVQFEGCVLEGTSDHDRKLSLSNCINAGSLVANDGGTVEVINNMGDDRTWQFNRCQHVTVDIDTEGGAATPILFDRCALVEAAIDSRDNTGDGFEVVACHRVEPYAGGITGSGNTGYGARFGGGGHYVMDGVDIAGAAGDFIIEDQIVTWALLAANETYIEVGTTVTVVGG
jgi:hypothetical protein